MHHPFCAAEGKSNMLFSCRTGVSDSPVGHSDVLFCNCTYGGKKQLNSVAAIMVTCNSPSSYGGEKMGYLCVNNLAVGIPVHHREFGRDL